MHFMYYYNSKQIKKNTLNNGNDIPKAENYDQEQYFLLL